MAASSLHRYDFEQGHEGMKQVGFGMDMFMFGLEPLGLLLFFGDLQGARAALAKVEDAHKRISDRIHQEEITLDRCFRFVSPDAFHSLFPDVVHSACRSYVHEAVHGCGMAGACAVLLMDDRDVLGKYMANNVIGRTLDDEVTSKALETFWLRGFGWRTDEGYFGVSVEVLLLTARGLIALGEENNDASRAALRKWLPSPRELLHTTKHAVRTDRF